MLLALETVFLCLLFFFFCWLGTGSDEKNLKSFRSYPPAVQEMLRKDPRWQGKIKEASPVQVFLSNVILFIIVLLPFGWSLKTEGFFGNFLNILIMGQAINGFDLLMDLLWFRRARRTRFEGTKEDDGLYRDPQNHIGAFLRGIPAFLLVAVIDGCLLMLF